MDDRIVIAQIGCGYWGPNLLRNFTANKKCRVKWVAEKSPERREYIKANYPNINVTDDWQTILADKEVDAVLVVTPANTHYALAKAVLKAGKHAFVEKPLARSVAEAEDLVNIAQKTGKTIFVGHTFLYNTAVRKVKEYIDNGTLGDIYYISAQRLNLGKVRQDVNAMWNLAPHDISIALYWLGEKPTQVSAKGLSFLQEGIEDAVFLNLDFPSKRAVHIHTSWLAPSKVRKIVVIGSKKMLVYDDVSTDAKITLYDKGIDKNNIDNDSRLEPINSFGQFQLMQRVGDMVVPYIKPHEPLAVLADNFLDSILNNTTSLSDGNNGLNVVRILEAAQHSLKNSQETVSL